MIVEALKKIIEGENLPLQEMVSVMNEVMEGEATPAQIAAFITALRIKVETVDEITGAATVMREKSTKINPGEGTVVDTCGTGGDGANTFNISTASAFVVAGCGVKVAKHGNRSVSSKCGSADVLKALGVNIEADIKTVEKCIDKVGIGFLFAPLLHGAMKHAAPVRKEIGIRTVFNILGPLTNPAGAKRQVIGVYDGALTEVMAKVLLKLGSEKAYIVHGSDGLDEITITGDTKVSELDKGSVKTYSINPEDFGVKKAKLEDIRGGDAEENAKIIESVLGGEIGPKSDIVALNAGAAIAASGVAYSINDGYIMAKDCLRNGKAKAKLEELKKVSN